MSNSIEVRNTYKYRLYRCDKRDKYLHRQINIAGTVWNHALALQKRYYRLTGKYIPLGVLKAHIAKAENANHPLCLLETAWLANGSGCAGTVG